MLQNIRDNSQGWIAKTIIGVIVVLLSLTGFEAITNVASNRDNAADVNGEPILKTELAQAVETQRRQLLQQFGPDFDASLIDDKFLRESALKTLIDRQIILQGSRDAGLVFPSAAMDQLLLRTPEFQVDGNFSKERFDQFVRERGMTRLQFRQRLEEEILVGQLRAGIAGSGFITADEVAAFVKLEKQTRDFASLTVKVDPDSVVVTDADIKSFYDENASRFMSEEQVVLEYVELSKDDFFDQVKVEPQALQELYQQEIASLAEQRQAAHILVETSESLSSDQAKAKIEELAARIAKGEDFAALAREFSDDPGSKDDGGDLGFAGPGVYEPAFEKALYALSKGELSAPVRTDYGWHLIKLLDVQAPEIPSFESLEEKLTADLKSQLVERRFVEAGEQLEGAAYEASDLSQPAQDLGLSIQTTPAFGRAGGKEGVSANRQVVREAFGDALLANRRNSKLIELDENTQVIVRVKDHIKSEALALETVSEQIRAELVAERARAAARAEGEKLLAALRAGETSGEGWELLEAATRAQDGVDPAVLQALFRMPKTASQESPAYAGVSTGTGDFALIRLSAVSEPEGELSEEERVMYARFLASRSGEQDYAAKIEHLRATADVEKF